MAYKVNNIKLKIKNLGKNAKKSNTRKPRKFRKSSKPRKPRRSRKTRKYKRIQYGCQKMTGGSALIDIPGNMQTSSSNLLGGLSNTFQGYNNNELYTSVTDYP